MNNLKCRKQKFNGTFECKKSNKIINIKECNNCKFKEFRESNNHQIKKRTYKQSKKEKERFSIIYQDSTKCCYCGSKNDHIDTNEVFGGAYRSLSIEYGACNYYCRLCHNRYDVDRLFSLKEKVKFQKKLVKIHGYDWFINNFKKDYEYLLSEYKKKSSK